MEGAAMKCIWALALLVAATIPAPTLAVDRPPGLHLPDRGVKHGRHLDPFEDFRAVPATRVAEQFGIAGRAKAYSLNEFDAHRKHGLAWAKDQVAEGAIPASRQDRAAAQRAEELRTKSYPRGWSKHDRHKLYTREVADLERQRTARDKRMEAAVREREHKRLEIVLPDMQARFKAAQEADRDGAAQ
jgi:hypothetical protein